MTKTLVFVVLWVYGCTLLEMAVPAEGNLFLIVFGAINYIVADAVSNQFR